MTKLSITSTVASGMPGQLNLAEAAPTLQVLTGVGLGLTSVNALSSCTALQQCYLSENTFSGTVLPLPDTTTLQTVKFMNNRFTGFDANYFTTNLTNLTIFDISYNTGLSGQFPSVTNLPKITTLQARSCALTGTLPVPTFSGLSDYAFDRNKLTGNALNIATYSGGFVVAPGGYNKNIQLSYNNLTGYTTGTNGRWPLSGNKIYYDVSFNYLTLPPISGLLRAAHLGSGTGHYINVGGSTNARLTGANAVPITGAGGLLSLLTGKSCTVQFNP